MKRMGFLLLMVLTSVAFADAGQCPYPKEMWKDMKPYHAGFYRTIAEYTEMDKYELVGNDCTAWKACKADCREVLGDVTNRCDFHLYYYSRNRPPKFAGSQIMTVMDACERKSLEEGEAYKNLRKTGVKYGSKEEFEKFCDQDPHDLTKPECRKGSRYVEGSLSLVCGRFIDEYNINSWTYKIVHECEPNDEEVNGSLSSNDASLPF